MESDLESWINNIATYSSIIGLAITIYVMQTVKKIKHSFFLRGRLPESIKELERLCTEIYRGAKKWDSDKEEVLISFAKTRGVLQTIMHLSPKEDHKVIKQIIYDVTPLNGFFKSKILRDLSKDEIWDIYAEIQSIISKLKEIKKDESWS